MKADCPVERLRVIVCRDRRQGPHPARVPAQHLTQHRVPGEIDMRDDLRLILRDDAPDQPALIGREIQPLAPRVTRRSVLVWVQRVANARVRDGACDLEPTRRQIPDRHADERLTREPLPDPRPEVLEHLRRVLDRAHITQHLGQRTHTRVDAQINTAPLSAQRAIRWCRAHAHPDSTRSLSVLDCSSIVSTLVPSASC